MKLRSAALAGGLAVAGLVAAAAPAAADSRDWICTSVYGGEGCFRSLGDDIYASDTVADGARAVVEWTVNYNRSTPDCVDRHADGNGNICYFNMREDGNSHIAFSVVIYKGDRPVRASDHVQVKI